MLAFGGGLCSLSTSSLLILLFQKTDNKIPVGATWGHRPLGGIAPQLFGRGGDRLHAVGAYAFLLFFIR